MINPQDGHILCDPYTAICGFSLRTLWSNKIANSPISRPKQILVALISALLVGDFRVERLGTFFYRTALPCAYYLRYSDRLGTFSRNRHPQ